MPRILIIGATGYVGRRVVDELVRTGEHKVYGIARSDEKAVSLRLAEATPIICPDPVNEPAPWLEAIRSHHIDVVVDVAGAFQDSMKFLREIEKIGEERLAVYKKRGVKVTPKLGFVYCSGTWIHGSGNQLISDLDIVGEGATNPPPALLEYRPAMEDAVLNASAVLDVAIVRPALIYGRESAIWESFWGPLLAASRSGSAETVRIPIDPDTKSGLIHVDDVATGFRLVIEKLPSLNSGAIYPVFNLFTSQESMKDIFEALRACWGVTGKIDLTGPGEDLFTQAFSTSQRGDSSRAKHILGWTPRRLEGLVSGMDIYAASFASQQ